MDNMVKILREEVQKYAANGTGLNLLLFPLLDDTNKTYAVTAVDYPTREQPAGVVVLARILANKIVIEEDMTDKKLVDALLQRGISRDDIVLAYAGEPLPTP